MSNTMNSTDRLSEIISKYVYAHEGIQVNDLDSWDTYDLQDALEILDNEICNRFNDESARESGY